MAHQNTHGERIGVIADDLTGAGDSGIQFSEKGLETTVIFEIAGAGYPEATEDVVVMNTESRSLSRDEAYEKAHECAAFLKESGVKHLYKKIDSTLRGNWVAEIQAAADVYEPDFIVVAPAFPEMGRTTMKGRQLLHGRPIEETQLANDPKTPVLRSEIPEIIKEQTDGCVEAIAAGEWSGAQWETELAGLQGAAPSWLVFDAETDADLERAATQLAATGYQFLWVGSAGLAKFLPEALEMVNTGQHGAVDLYDSPVLVVAGSTSEITKKQIQLLLDLPGVHGIELDPMTIFDEQINDLTESISEEAGSQLEAGYEVILYPGSSPKQMEEVFQAGAEKGCGRAEVSNMISQLLGTMAKAITSRVPVRNMILTGGDTAIDVYRCLGFAGMKLVKEIEPGLPLGQFIGESTVNVVTKAGAFGSERSLVHAVNCLKKGCLE